MNYITYEKDIAQSKSFYETFKACIQPKQCHDNIKRIIFDTKAHPYQIAFGYMSSGTVDNLYFRHAFFLSPEGKVIDPTIPEKEKNYYVFAAINCTDYLKYLLREKRADLTMVLMDKDRQMQAWLMSNKNIICIG